MNTCGVPIPGQPGTYALVLGSTAVGVLRIGRPESLEIRPGVDVYIGIAFGPGGLLARIRHHRQIARR